VTILDLPVMSGLPLDRNTAPTQKHNIAIRLNDFLYIFTPFVYSTILGVCKTPKRALLRSFFFVKIKQLLTGLW